MVASHITATSASSIGELFLSGGGMAVFHADGRITTRAGFRPSVAPRGVLLTSGAWYFEIAAEQKSCHFAQPPPTSEHVNYIVVEGGVSSEGWQAGLMTVHPSGSVSRFCKRRVRVRRPSWSRRCRRSTSASSS